MLDKMKQLMEMKRQADQIKRELDAERVECEDVQGIKIVMNGAQYMQLIEVDESLLNPAAKNQFQKDLLRSVNGAIAKSQQVAAQKMKSMMPGFPGI